GFAAIEWMRFEGSPAGIEHKDWKPFAEQFASEAKARGVRISAIGALYRNPLDPRQTEFAQATFRRAIEVAAHIGVKTVAGFAGGVIETELDERGGNPVYKPFENFLPRLLGFWEPLARFGGERGVRIAFEHSPQGQLPVPLQNYNIVGQRALSE